MYNSQTIGRRMSVFHELNSRTIYLSERAISCTIQQNIKVGKEALQDVPHARLASDTESPDVQPADENGVRTESHRFEYVGGAADAAVEQDGEIWCFSDGVDDVCELVEGGDGPIDLAAS